MWILFIACKSYFISMKGKFRESFPLILTENLMLFLKIKFIYVNVILKKSLFTLLSCISYSENKRQLSFLLSGLHFQC
uniref:Uncharacterized protein n=1 Tax=Rhizophora mucronata TaxID=61149 RepID=A0A2P2NRC8_RHIMU